MVAGGRPYELIDTTKEQMMDVYIREIQQTTIAL